MSVAGDAASLAAAFAMIGYLLVGRRLRNWMPIFVYACPVTGSAALLLSLAALATDGHAVIGADGRGVLGWIASGAYAPYVVYLALGPGLAGHTGLNTCLRYMTPLMIGLATTLEPAVGPFIGWLLGVLQPPGIFTYVGGIAIFTSTVLVTLATAKRQKQEERAERTLRGIDLSNRFSEVEDTQEQDSLLVKHDRVSTQCGGSQS